MKTLMAIMMVTLIAATQSSGREPGAAMFDAAEAPDLAQGNGSGLPPGALVFCAAEEATTFATIDITIDPLGQALGAYQFELTTEDATFTVVGVEAGDHAAFDRGRPPYFDPIATQGETDRLILAEYAKPALDADQLPNDATRIATVHVMFIAQPGEDEPPTIQLTLTAAGNADGERIDAKISYSFRTPERPE